MDAWPVSILQLNRRGRELRGAVLELPLREPQTDWKAGAGGLADRRDNLHRKTRPFGQVFPPDESVHWLVGCQKI